MSFPSSSGSGDDHPMDHRRTDHVPNASPNQRAFFKANLPGEEAVIEPNERPQANPFLDEDEQEIDPEMDQLIDQLISLTDDLFNDEPRDHLTPLEPPGKTKYFALDNIALFQR